MKNEKNICVASAHINCDNTDLWAEIQWKFLDKYTDTKWDYIIVANGCDPSIFRHADNVIHFKSRVSHYDSIQEIVNYFRDNDYSHLLLLDSDAWPVRYWPDIALRMMEDRYYLAPMRVENYDDFPHPSSFFMKRSFLEFVNFGYYKRSNLFGDIIQDVGTAMPQTIDNSMAWVPLLKTNVWSPHPIYFSIYGDLFYHHCGGSRRPGGRGVAVRGLSTGTYSAMRYEHGKIYDKITSMLIDNSEKLISDLRNGISNS